ncbi:hypothetical protein PC116_g26479 [Phytophthora cactorum]|uniref:Uncharacterized protein n=1 Tax=Phytophthora cactorum TaxID=29920 RepID=A0A8T1JNR4_9STRA|nr:hypothetical protein PC117_g24573 [Phytophthora cactorum]KAG3053391.1 hypothetical protein PC122_g22357 [Phytophthora cactorum]KAG4225080.1 hypothetical protein PC116_g26479 [Phytophthora cactorum]
MPETSTSSFATATAFTSYVILNQAHRDSLGNWGYAAFALKSFAACRTSRLSCNCSATERSARAAPGLVAGRVQGSLRSGPQRPYGALPLRKALALQEHAEHCRAQRDTGDVVRRRRTEPITLIIDSDITRDSKKFSVERKDVYTELTTLSALDEGSK